MNIVYFTAENIHAVHFCSAIRFAVRRKDDCSVENMEFIMNMKSSAKGAAAGAVVGITYYALSSAAPVKKYSIKKNAGKTLKSAASLLDDIKSVLM